MLWLGTYGNWNKNENDFKSLLLERLPSKSIEARVQVSKSVRGLFQKVNRKFISACLLLMSFIGALQNWLGSNATSQHREEKKLASLAKSVKWLYLAFLFYIYVSPYRKQMCYLWHSFKNHSMLYLYTWGTGGYVFFFSY